MGKLVQFGAGNIGRSFIGQLFATNGYEVVFVDVAKSLVDALNRRGNYNVVIKRDRFADEIITVKNVRAIDGNDKTRVAEEIATATYVATSVGMNSLPSIFDSLAAGIALREKRSPSIPLDIIIAENINNGAAYFESELARCLPGFSRGQNIGLVETSIGKMVPLMRAEDLEHDPLCVFAEAYNELIVDKHGFKGSLLEIKTLRAVDNIRAYVDRKLFVHNMGHAATAYLGYRASEKITYIWQALEVPGIVDTVRRAMKESATALSATYPAALAPADLDIYIDDLLSRFANKPLGDTIHRVGRDLYRKLAHDDRLVGAMLLAAKHKFGCATIASVIRAAIDFRAPDESGKLFPRDAEFASIERPKGIRGILRDVSRLDPSDPIDKSILDCFDP
jgi:mannitol-1-phosphate 5-dehydrogenase